MAHLLRLMIISSVITLFFSLPPKKVSAEMSSPNYKIEGEDVTSGGQAEASSNYSVWEDIAGWFSSKFESTSYKIGGGPTEQIQAYGPAQPTFQNDSGERYDRLEFIVDDGGNPTDALFAIAITSDNWATTNFVQTNNTIGASIAWQTLANWGGVTGEFVTGLTPDTTYAIKVAASRGDFTMSPYSEEASAVTVSPQITFDVDIGAAPGETAAPYAISLGELYFNTITTSSSNIYLNLDTNSEVGTVVYVKDANSGLRSDSAPYTIASASEELQANQDTNDGYGLQNGTWSASSGSWTESATYDVSGNNVGAVSNSWVELANTNSDPIDTGTGEIKVLAVAAKATPAKDDYSDVVTFRVIPTY